MQFGHHYQKNHIEQNLTYFLRKLSKNLGRDRWLHNTWLQSAFRNEFVLCLLRRSWPSFVKIKEKADEVNGWLIQSVLGRSRQANRWDKSFWRLPSTWWQKMKTVACRTSVQRWSRQLTRCLWHGDCLSIIVLRCTTSVRSRSSGRGDHTCKPNERARRSLRKRSLQKKYKKHGEHLPTFASTPNTRI